MYCSMDTLQGKEVQAGAIVNSTIIYIHILKCNHGTKKKKASGKVLLNLYGGITVRVLVVLTFG